MNLRRRILLLLVATLMTGASLLSGCCGKGWLFGGGDDASASQDLDAKINRAASEIGQMVKVIHRYQSQFGKLPETLTQAQSAMGVQFPALDPWGRPYDYRAIDDGFVLFSRGEDPNDEEDDIYYDTAPGRVILPDPQPMR